MTGAMPIVLIQGHGKTPSHWGRVDPPASGTSIHKKDNGGIRGSQLFFTIPSNSCRAKTPPLDNSRSMRRSDRSQTYSPIHRSRCCAPRREGLVVSLKGTIPLRGGRPWKSDLDRRTEAQRNLRGSGFPPMAEGDLPATAFAGDHRPDYPVFFITAWLQEERS